MGTWIQLSMKYSTSQSVIKRPTDGKHTTSAQTDITSGQTRTASEQAISTNDQTSNTSGKTCTTSG